MEIKIEKKTLKIILLVVLVAILFAWILYSPNQWSYVFHLLGEIFTPFMVGLVIAFIINVPMRWIESKMTKLKRPKLRRVLAMCLAFLLVMAILAGVLWLLIPELIQTISDLIPQLTSFITDLEEDLKQFLKDNPEISEWLGNNENFDWAKLLQDNLAEFSKNLSSILSKTWGAFLTIGGFFIDAFIAVIFAIYILFQKELLARQGRRLLYAFLPERFADRTIHVLRLSNSAFSRFLSGQCVEVCILGIMFAISMAIFDMPFIPLICVLIAITAFVPYVGAWVACIVGAFLIMVVDPTKAIWFVVMSLVIQQIENNLIYPKVVGTSIGLSGMWVLLAISIGGALFDIVGMIIMIPIASVIYTLLSELTRKRLQRRNVAADKLVAHEPEIRKRRKDKKLTPNSEGADEE